MELRQFLTREQGKRHPLHCTIVTAFCQRRCEFCCVGIENEAHFKHFCSLPSYIWSQMKFQSLKLHLITIAMLQRREGEANVWEKWSTLSNILLIQGHIELHRTRILSYSVGSLCHPVHIYLLHISSILLTDYIIVMVRIVQKACRCF
jgi:hypothetical protein